MFVVWCLWLVDGRCALCVVCGCPCALSVVGSCLLFGGLWCLLYAETCCCLLCVICYFSFVVCCVP